MGRSHVKVVSSMLAMAVLGGMAASAQAAGGVALSTRVEPAAGKAFGTGAVTVSVTNFSKRSVLVLGWETPLNGVSEDLFSVKGPDGLRRYIGMDVKRAAPTADDFIEFAPGETKSVTLNLSEYYDISDAAAFEVALKGEFSQVYAVSDRDNDRLLPAVEAKSASNAAMIFVDKMHLTPAPDYSYLVGAKAGSQSYVGCSSTRQSQIASGFSGAKSYASNSNSYLASGAAGPRYTTWFGTYSSSRYAKIKQDYLNIASTFSNQAMVFDCSTCTMSAYAYVYPNQPYKIYLCSAFWSAPTTGTDSKAGTIIHETSHFDVVANTDDNAYGQTACKKLATQNPTKAVYNADSHEYFSENTPFQN